MQEQKIGADAVVKGLFYWILGWNLLWFSVQAIWQGSLESLFSASFSNAVLVSAYLIGYPIYVAFSRLFLMLAIYSAKFYDSTVKHDDDFVRMIASRENRMLFSLAWPLTALVVVYWLVASTIVMIFRGVF